MDDKQVNDTQYRRRVYEIVNAIPVGRVMTYGQIAGMLGDGYTPRTVGFVMHAADTENVPWQRVINSQGACSTGRMTVPVNLQQDILESEGVKFNEKGRCDLAVCRWSPDGFDDKADDEQPSLFG
ncbi:MAG: MGMT family protein [Acidobacteriota bacterium]|nr:MGMT family protein [Acidobacteriota bacterium]